MLCFTETKLDASVSESNLLIASFYPPIRKDRQDGRGGGGVAVYISQSLGYRRREDLEHVNIECIWLEISDNVRTILLCVLYKPPNVPSRNHWTDFETSLDKALDRSTQLIVGGDFNENFLDNRPGHICFTMLSRYSLHNLITEATRVTSNTATLIDPIIISKNVSVLDSGIIDSDNVCEIST